MACMEKFKFRKRLTSKDLNFLAELRKIINFLAHWLVAALGTILRVEAIFKLKVWGWSLLTLWNLTITSHHKMNSIL